MNKLYLVTACVLLMTLTQGCSTPSQRIGGLRLGMTPDEVLDEMGRPYAVRSAKLFRDGSFQEVWEYIPSIFSVALFADRYDKIYWVYFDDGRLVQWGEPGDFTGEEDMVLEHIPDRRTR